jgi:hypothetical protein
MAFVIPVNMKSDPERGPQLLMIILTKDNLERMKEGDPFDMQTRAYASQMNLSAKLGDLDIVVAYEGDEVALTKLAADGDLAGIIARIGRGRVHKPGDAAPPVSLRKRRTS